MVLKTALANMEILQSLEPHQRTCVTIDPETLVQSITLDGRWFQGVRRSLSAGCSREDLRQAIHWTMTTLFKYDIDTTMVATILKKLQKVLSVTYPDFTSMHDSLNELLEETSTLENFQRQLAFSSSGPTEDEGEDAPKGVLGLTDSLETPVFKPSTSVKSTSVTTSSPAHHDPDETLSFSKDDPIANESQIDTLDTSSVVSLEESHTSLPEPKLATISKAENATLKKRKKRKKQKKRHRKHRRNVKPKKHKKRRRRTPKQVALKDETSTTKCHSFCCIL
jgi:hypothetical protein